MTAGRVDGKPVTWIALHTKGGSDISELGLVSMTRQSGIRTVRHVKVRSSWGQYKPTTDLASELGASKEVGIKKDLLPILDLFFAEAQSRDHFVILTGFALVCDLMSLKRSLNWEPPTNMIEIDAQEIKGLFQQENHSSLEKALADFRTEQRVGMGLNNPAHAAW